MRVLEGLHWGWTNLPGPVAREKGKGGMALGLEHLQCKPRGCGSPAPRHPRGSGKAALVLLSRDMVPMPGYLSQGPQMLCPPGKGPFLSLASQGCEGNGEGRSSHMLLALWRVLGAGTCPPH